jgi:hypothetical protein
MKGLGLVVTLVLFLTACATPTASLVTPTPEEPVLELNSDQPPLAGLQMSVTEEDDRLFYSVTLSESEPGMVVAWAGADQILSPNRPFATSFIRWDEEVNSAGFSFSLPLTYGLAEAGQFHLLAAPVLQPQNYLKFINGEFEGRISGQQQLDSTKVEYELEFSQSFKVYQLKVKVQAGGTEFTVEKTPDSLSVSPEIPEKLLPLNVVGLTLIREDGKYKLKGKITIPLDLVFAKSGGELAWDFEEGKIVLKLPKGTYPSKVELPEIVEGVELTFDPKTGQISGAVKAELAGWNWEVTLEGKKFKSRLAREKEPRVNFEIESDGEKTEGRTTIDLGPVGFNARLVQEEVQLGVTVIRLKLDATKKPGSDIRFKASGDFDLGEGYKLKLRDGGIDAQGCPTGDFKLAKTFPIDLGKGYKAELGLEVGWSSSTPPTELLEEIEAQRLYQKAKTIQATISTWYDQAKGKLEWKFIFSLFVPF